MESKKSDEKDLSPEQSGDAAGGPLARRHYERPQVLEEATLTTISLACPTDKDFRT